MSDSDDTQTTVPEPAAAEETKPEATEPAAAAETEAPAEPEKADDGAKKEEAAAEGKKEEEEKKEDVEEDKAAAEKKEEPTSSSEAKTTGVDIDKWIAEVEQKKWLPERDFHTLCDMVKDILGEESNVQPVSTPVTVCGDIHGQFPDLLELFKTGGSIASGKRYIFMGDYVDRGNYSLETLTYLLLLKVRYPDRITLLRGNHESRQITQVYGFYEECLTKYGNVNPWKWCTQVFDYLTVAALIDGRILCVHGGLSPDIRTIDQIRSSIPRKQEIPHDGAFCDLVWSDPEEVDGMTPSNRGAGYLFGASVVREFVDVNGLELISRSHQLVQEGYKYFFPPENFLVTVWSAPNYCYRCGNIAAIMEVDEKRNRKFLTFDAVEQPSASFERTTIPYFL